MTLRVLYVASEAFPLIKTGGLADVIGALPLALAREGADVKVLLPGYPAVLAALEDIREAATFDEGDYGRSRLLSSRHPSGLDLFVLDAPHWFSRPGNPYVDLEGKDWADNPLRFAAFCQAAVKIALGSISWQPDVVHIHDWQTGLVPAYLRFAGRPSPPVVLTIHNLAFQGLCPAGLLTRLGLPPRSFVIDGLEFYGQISFLKSGIVYADRITTVSPTYAKEICTPVGGMGLDGILRARQAVLLGITNGIDDDLWNPAADPHLKVRYEPVRLLRKALNKHALQRRMGLRENSRAPLFGIVTRLSEQKGLDLLKSVLPQIINRGGQLVMLGAGSAALEADFLQLASRLQGRVGVVLGYDEALSHQIQGGADVILVPSRFEPCGLTQLYGLRYGTLPLVARVGGLADTIIDANQAALDDGVATGFQFAPVSADAFALAIERAFDLHARPAAWRAVQRRAMSREVGWSKSARRYLALYRDLVAAKDI